MVDTALGAATAAELTRQLDAEKIAALSERVETLLRQNDQLRQQLEKSESQTHEFVTYFQREMEIKDEIIVALNSEFERTKLTLEKELKVERAERDEERKQLLAEKQNSEAALLVKLQTAEEELAQVEAFRDAKDSMAKSIMELKSTMAATEKVHAEDMLHQERKFLADKAQAQRQMDENREKILQQARMEAQASLDVDTQRIVHDNRRMAEELKFQQQITAELEAEKDRLGSQNRELRRDVEMLRDTERMASEQAAHRTNELKGLRAENAKLGLDLESAKIKAHADVERKVEESHKQLEELKIDSIGLRKLLKLKNKELRHIRKLAQTILEQRTETEHFLLESMEEVKRRKRAEALEVAILQKKEYNEQLRLAMSGRCQFPPIKPPQELQALEAGLTDPQESKLPANFSEKVKLDDLTWEDKERVLRLLFAKINAVDAKGIQSLPEHPLTAPDLVPPTTFVAGAQEQAT